LSAEKKKANKYLTEKQEALEALMKKKEECEH
jgi:hypothetical protein